MHSLVRSDPVLNSAAAASGSAGRQRGGAGPRWSPQCELICFTSIALIWKSKTNPRADPGAVILQLPSSGGAADRKVGKTESRPEQTLCLLRRATHNHSHRIATTKLAEGSARNDAQTPRSTVLLRWRRKLGA